MGHHTPRLYQRVYAKAEAGDVPGLDALYRARDAAKSRP
jgi:hypothetical protein